MGSFLRDPGPEKGPQGAFNLELGRRRSTRRGPTVLPRIPAPSLELNGTVRTETGSLTSLKLIPIPKIDQPEAMVNLRDAPSENRRNPQDRHRTKVMPITGIGICLRLVSRTKRMRINYTDLQTYSKSSSWRRQRW